MTDYTDRHLRDHKADARETKADARETEQHERGLRADERAVRADERAVRADERAVRADGRDMEANIRTSHADSRDMEANVRECNETCVHENTINLISAKTDRIDGKVDQIIVLIAGDPMKANDTGLKGTIMNIESRVETLEETVVAVKSGFWQVALKVCAWAFAMAAAAYTGSQLGPRT